MDDAKGLWAKQLHEDLWSYTTTHSTIKGLFFTMVYDTKIMLVVKIDTPTWWCVQFNEEEKDTKFRHVVDLVDKTKEIAHII